MSVNKDFLPKINHHFYFIRKGLYEGIKKRSNQMTGNLLDFGCGEKPYKSLFTVDSYVGLDYENPGHDHKNENIDVFYDGRNIPFSDDYFDSVLCSEVFEHLFDIEHTLQQIHRVLKKGGKLLITCPFVWNEHEIPHDYARYTVFALNHLFEKHGFDVVNFEKSGSFIETITQMRVLYFFNNVSPFLSKIPGGRYLSILIISFYNFFGMLKNSLLPPKNELYLSNIFLVEKV